MEIHPASVRQETRATIVIDERGSREQKAPRLREGYFGVDLSRRVIAPVTSSGGGYTGHIVYGASFKAGRPPSIFKAQTDDEPGFNRPINHATRKQMKDCRRVQNDPLAALLGASDRPTVDVSQ